MIENIETKILETLEADSKKAKSPLEKIKIERCPEDAASRMMNAATGSVWIHFAGVKPSDPNGIYSAVQEDVLYFDIDIIMRNLRTGNTAIVTDRAGAYDVIDRVRAVLTGFKPALKAKPMWMTNCELTEAGRGFWYYTARFAVRVPYTAAAGREDETVYGIAREITFHDGRTVIVKSEKEN